MGSISLRIALFFCCRPKCGASSYWVSRARLSHFQKHLLPEFPSKKQEFSMSSLELLREEQTLQTLHSTF